MQEGLVYKITFPDGYFYIGKTKDLLTRMKAHFSTKNGCIYSRARRFCSCSKDLMKFTTVLYAGLDYSKQEVIQINELGEDEFLLNKDLVGIDKFRIAAHVMGISLVQLGHMLGMPYNEFNTMRLNSPEVLLQKRKNWDEASMLLDGLLKK